MTAARPFEQFRGNVRGILIVVVDEVWIERYARAAELLMTGQRRTLLSREASRRVVQVLRPSMRPKSDEWIDPLGPHRQLMIITTSTDLVPDTLLKAADVIVYGLRLIFDPSLPDNARELSLGDFWDGLEELDEESRILVSVEIKDFDDDPDVLAVLTDYRVPGSPDTVALTYEYRARAGLGRAPTSERDFQFSCYGGRDPTRKFGYDVRSRISMDVLPALKGIEEFGVFTNSDTLEMDLFKGAFTASIIEGLREGNFGKERMARIDAWEEDPTTVDRKQLLAMMEDIGKGRFAQRMAPRVRGLEVPGYIARAISYVVDRV